MRRIPVLALVLIAAGAQSAWAEIYVQNDRTYVGDDGVPHIVGEVRNDLDVPLNQISVRALLYDGTGRLIDDVSSHTLVNNVMPGMRAPFDILVLDGHARGFYSYDLDLEYNVGAPKSQVIDVTSSRLSRDGLDNLVITGTVANNGETTANTVSVVATLYDRDGNVAAISRAHTEPDYLRSSGEAFFLVSVPDKTQTGSVVDYALVAESEEYAAVPEFPLGSGVLLVLSVATYLALTRYGGRAIAGVAAAADPA